jgi:hypothetical protein
VVNNSTNINKMNNHFSLAQIKKTTAFEVGNPGPGLWQMQAQKCDIHINIRIMDIFFQQYYIYNMEARFLLNKTEVSKKDKWHSISYWQTSTIKMVIRTYHNKWTSVPQTLVLTWTNFIGREKNRIVGLMVSMLALSEVHINFGPMSGQKIDYKIGICCFSPISA